MTDENGKTYEPTWFKRANGLVKKGRARWQGERTICLTCPPVHTEDAPMDEYYNDALPAAHAAPAEAGECPEPVRAGLTPEGILERMDAIRRDMTDLKDLAASERADAALFAAFAAREQTHQQQLSFLERIYQDHFSLSAEKEKTDRTKMILDQMNSALAGYHASGREDPEEVRALVEFFGTLFDKA